jgi:hypothetical protein
MRVASDIVRSIVRQLQRFRVGPAMAHSEGRDATAVTVRRCPPQRSPGRHLAVSAGHVKKPDLLRMRPVEHTDRFGRGLQQYLAALLREISLSFRR